MLKKHNMKIFKNGLITGLFIQLAIGPVFFFTVNLALQKTILDGLIAVIAVTIVDYLYITLAIFGIGKLLEQNKIKKIFGIISSIILIIFGIIIIQSITNESISPTANNSTNLLTSFTTTFFLAISNPMIILWNTSVLTAKSIEYNYSKRELLIFGLSIGLATPIIFGTSVILLYLLKATIPILLIQTLNFIVGSLLIGYGSLRLIKITKNT